MNERLLFCVDSFPNQRKDEFYTFFCIGRGNCSLKPKLLQNIIFLVPDSNSVNLSAYDDINIVCGALKQYFRMLPIPVITFELYNKFIDAASKLLFLYVWSTVS